MIIYLHINKTKAGYEDIENKVVDFCNKNKILLANHIDYAQVAISIGGDGTFIDMAKIAANKNVLLLGINNGTLGYLTDVEKDNIETALQNILSNNYFVEERMMLDGSLVKNETIVCNETALNDICLIKNSFDIIRFDVYIDDVLINNYTADGMIVATPTGSTAYNLSNHGPIIQPTANNIVLTPLSPHTLMNQSLVLGPSSEIKLVVKEIRNKNKKCLAVFDGCQYEMEENDIINIKKSNTTTKIIKFNQDSFLQTIRQKMI